MTALTDRQRALFAEQGYLVLPGVFDEPETAAFAAEAEFILDLIVNSSIYNRRSSSRLDVRSVDGAHVVRKIQPINDLSLILSKAERDSRLLDPLRSLMQDEPVLMEEKLNYKQSLGMLLEHLIALPDDDHFPLHHDWAYYQAQGYPQDILSSAITIDAMAPDTGPIRVWPGTHKTAVPHRITPLYENHPTFKELEVLPGTVDPNDGIDVIAPPGSVLLFHALLVHASTANRSARPRRVMIYSHYPKRANMGFDVRNGRTRLHESPHELKYLRARLERRFTPAFPPQPH